MNTREYTDIKDLPGQKWVLLRESMNQMEPTHSVLSHSEITARDWTLSDFLRLLKENGKPKEYNFYIYSHSMVAAVRLLTDASIKVMYELYSRDDFFVMIIMRDASDPSPNSLQCPTHEVSMMALRRGFGGQADIPAVPIRARSRHVLGGFDSASMQLVTTTRIEQDMVDALKWDPTISKAGTAHHHRLHTIGIPVPDGKVKEAVKKLAKSGSNLFKGTWKIGCGGPEKRRGACRCHEYEDLMCHSK